MFVASPSRQVCVQLLKVEYIILGNTKVLFALKKLHTPNAIFFIIYNMSWKRCDKCQRLYKIDRHENACNICRAKQYNNQATHCDVCDIWTDDASKHVLGMKHIKAYYSWKMVNI
jgi:hypothetical protein